MGKKLYVGNLGPDTTTPELEALFAEHGTVVSANVILDRDTGRCRGFGFVEMESDAEAKAAMEALDGTEMGDRAIKVNEARPRPAGGGGRPRGRPGGPSGGPRRPRD
jgi:RNA recognition motif-containing protein